jgi:hypothetical protein
MGKTEKGKFGWRGWKSGNGGKQIVRDLSKKTNYLNDTLNKKNGR